MELSERGARGKYHRIGKTGKMHDTIWRLPHMGGVNRSPIVTYEIENNPAAKRRTNWEKIKFTHIDVGEVQEDIRTDTVRICAEQIEHGSVALATTHVEFEERPNHFRIRIMGRRFMGRPVRVHDSNLDISLQTVRGLICGKYGKANEARRGN